MKPGELVLLRFPEADLCPRIDFPSQLSRIRQRLIEWLRG